MMAFKTLPEAGRLAAARQLNPAWDDEELLPWAESKTELDFALFSAFAGALTYPWRDTLARITCQVRAFLERN